MPLDPSKPAVKGLIALAQELWGAYIQTHTLADIDELDRQIERNRVIRRRLFDPVPILSEKSTEGTAS